MRHVSLIFMVSIAFILFSCDTGNMETEVNPFIGTWENEDGLQYTFTEKEITQNGFNLKDPLQFTGTYTYDDTYITINTNYRNPSISDFEVYPNPFVWPYSIEDDILTIAYGVVKKTSK